MTDQETLRRLAEAWDEGYRHNQPFQTRAYRNVLNPYLNGRDPATEATCSQEQLQPARGQSSPA